jgi:hypothetical protein
MVLRARDRAVRSCWKAYERVAPLGDLADLDLPPAERGCAKRFSGTDNWRCVQENPFMTTDQATVTTDQLTSPSQVLATRLLELVDADLQMIGRSSAEFDNSFDNAFSNIA